MGACGFGPRIGRFAQKELACRQKVLLLAPGPGLTVPQGFENAVFRGDRGLPYLRKILINSRDLLCECSELREPRTVFGCDDEGKAAENGFLTAHGDCFMDVRIRSAKRIAAATAR